MHSAHSGVGDVSIRGEVGLSQTYMGLDGFGTSSCIMCRFSHTRSLNVNG